MTTPRSAQDIQHLVFDLDETLVLNIPQPGDRALQNFSKSDQVLIEKLRKQADKISFKDIDRSYTRHVLFLPGAKELMLDLFKLPHVKVSFFSTGFNSRSTAIVRRLLAGMWEKELVEFKKRKECLLSSEAKRFEMQEGFIHAKYKIWLEEVIVLSIDDADRVNGTYKKNLKNSSLKKHTRDDLSNTLLIDDWVGVISPEQKQHNNFLHVNGVTLRDFLTMESADKQSEAYQNAYRNVHQVDYLRNFLEKLLKQQGGTLVDNMHKLCGTSKKSTQDDHEYCELPLIEKEPEEILIPIKSNADVMTALQNKLVLR